MNVANPHAPGEPWLIGVTDLFLGSQINDGLKAFLSQFVDRSLIGDSANRHILGIFNKKHIVTPLGTRAKTRLAMMRHSRLCHLLEFSVSQW